MVVESVYGGAEKLYGIQTTQMIPMDIGLQLASVVSVMQKRIALIKRLWMKAKTL